MVSTHTNKTFEVIKKFFFVLKNIIENELAPLWLKYNFPDEEINFSSYVRDRIIFPGANFVQVILTFRALEMCLQVNTTFVFNISMPSIK